LLERAAPCLIEVETDHDAVQIYRRRVLHDYEVEDVVTAILAGC
jgi:hypothetical protein